MLTNYGIGKIRVVKRIISNTRCLVSQNKRTLPTHIFDFLNCLHKLGKIDGCHAWSPYTICLVEGLGSMNGMYDVETAVGNDLLFHEQTKRQTLPCSQMVNTSIYCGIALHLYRSSSYFSIHTLFKRDSVYNFI